MRGRRRQFAGYGVAGTLADADIHLHTSTYATPTSSASSAEYQASGAVVLTKASYAYEKGVTGKGVTIDVIDSGINTTTPKFAGRISPGSTGFAQVVARCATCA